VKTKQKIFFAKIIFKIIRIFFPKKIKVKRNNINWNLNLSEAIDLHIFVFGSFEIEITNVAKNLQLQKHNQIIDIGANFGVQSLQFAKNFTNSKIYSVEPTNYAFNKFIKNLELNQKLSKNIYPFQIFLGSKEKVIPTSIYSSWNLETKENKHVKHLGEKKGTEESNSLTLDEFVILNKISNVDFIKLDVDGFEYNVLKGGINFLKDKKPPIFMELAPYLYKEYGYNKEKILKLITSLDYNFYDLKKLKKIFDIDRKISNIKDGSSENILLM